MGSAESQPWLDVRRSRSATVVSVLASAASVWLIQAATMIPFAVAAVAMTFPWSVGLGFTVAVECGLWLYSRSTPIGDRILGLMIATALAHLTSTVALMVAQRGHRDRLSEQRLHALEVSEERNRMARDVHDILGHSLTAITLKAELASKLIDQDPARARVELGELAEVSRTALTEVRAAVNNHRDISLAAELARADQLLEAAGVRAELPGSIDAVPEELRGLFAWGVRETTANVARHARARHCTVQVSRHALVVTDDGIGCAPTSQGHGLEGLRERARGIGAGLRIGPARPDLDRPGCRVELIAAPAVVPEYPPSPALPTAEVIP